MKNERTHEWPGLRVTRKLYKPSPEFDLTGRMTVWERLPLHSIDHLFRQVTNPNFTWQGSTFQLVLFTTLLCLIDVWRSKAGPSEQTSLDVRDKAPGGLHSDTLDLSTPIRLSPEPEVALRSTSSPRDCSGEPLITYYRHFLLSSSIPSVIETRGTHHLSQVKRASR